MTGMIITSPDNLSSPAVRIEQETGKLPGLNSFRKMSSGDRVPDLVRTQERNIP